MSKNPFEKYLEASQRQYANHEYNLQVVRELMPQIEPVKSLEGSFPKSKTLNDYIGDTAVDATKAAMTLAQTGISALDLGAYSLGGLGSSVLGIGHAIAPETIAKPVWNEYGLVTKALDDGLGFNIGKAKQTLGELGYSDIRKAQEAELHTGYSKEEIEAFKNQWTNDFYLQYQDLANKGANALQLEAFKSQFDGNYKKAYAQFMDKYQTSWDKPLGENLDIIGHAFGKVMDNPSLGVGAAIESIGYLLPSLAVSRGIAALQGAKLAATAGGKAVAAGTSEGLVSALALNEQMRGNSATGTIDGTKVAAGFAGGAVTGLIGGVSNKLGSRFGLDDVDSLGLGTQAKGFSVTRPVLATGQEAGEEFLQGFGESIIPNIAEGKDPLQGLAQELALGTVAGGIMGGATNARSLVSGAGSDLVSGLKAVGNVIAKGKDAITAKTFEELNDPTNKNYDPAKAFNSQVPKTNSQDDAEREEALANMESVFTNLETHKGNLINEKGTAQGILKNIAALPPEEQAKNLKAKGQAENLVKDLDARIIAADNQLMDLFEQKLTLAKNQEVQAGVPQYSEEQAKQDIEVLSQQPTESVWSTEDNDGNALSIPVTVIGTPVSSDGYETVEVKYTDSTGKERTTYAPTAELTQDTTTQQEAVERVTKHFSKLSLDELDTVAKSPYLTEEQRNSLRYLSETKRAIADMADTGTVTRHIMNGLKGKTAAESHRGLNNYSDMISKAISTKDEKLLNLALNDLGRFAQDHTDKANALVEAHQLAVSGKFPNLQVLRPKNGTWGIVTDPNKFVDDVKRTATGGWNVHRNTNNNGSIDAVTKEATLIQDTLKSLTQVSLSFGLQAVEPTVTAPVSIEALKEANKPTPTQSLASGIYTKLPTKTISGNVVQQSWGKLKTATKAVYDKVVISTRIPNTDEHFGNPFSSDSKVLANNPTLIKTNSTKESVEKYIDWVLNSKDARAKWIREQLKSGNLKGKQILYYTELNEPSHATALDYLINNYDWNTESTSTPNQEVDTPTPKIGETTTEVKERFTITKTVVSDNTALSVHTNNDTGEVTKSEYATTYPDIYSDELGDKYTLVIYRDSANPSVITDVESFDPKDKKNSIGSYGKQGNQTDEKFITTFTEESDVTLEYTNKFEKSLPVVKPKTPKEASAKVVPPVNVWAGSNENAGLSNLATRPFTFGGKKYQSVEHAYQTLKSGSFDQQTYDKYAGTENKKIAGNKDAKTTGNANIRLMEKLMTASFEQNKDAMELLQKTGDAVITHNQDKSIWGKEFPRILMEIRENSKTTPVEAATPSDTVSIDKLEATVKSFVKVRDITSEEYKQGTATVYEMQWFKVKAAYNNTVRRLVELVSKGVTTVEDVAALTDILNKLYEFAEQTIDLNSDRAALDKLNQRIDSLATALFSDVSPEIIDAYLKGKTESLERRGDKLTTDRDGAKSFDGRTIEYAFNAPHLEKAKATTPSTQTEVTETVSIEPKEQAKPSITLQEYGNQTIVTFGDTKEVLRADDLKYYNDKVNALIADKLLYAVFDERSIKSKQYAGFVKKLKENGFIPVVGLEYILSKEGKNPYEEYKKLTEKSNLNTGNEPQLDTTAPQEAEPIIPETVDGLVKEHGYLGELLEDEDVDPVFKKEVEKILKLKADRASKKEPTFVSFNDLLTFDGGIEYITRLAKNDPNISKLTKAAYKLRGLMGIVQHHSTLENYTDKSISAQDLKDYLNKYPQLKSIFEEVRKQKHSSLVHAVAGDIKEAKDVLSAEMDKLITLVGLFYIRAAFEKGQQYLIDTNYADLKEVIFPFTLGLLSNKHLGHLQKNRVVGDDGKGVRKLITPTELAFVDKIDGIPVGELSKEDFETVKALVQNRINVYFNEYEVLEYPRRPEKVYSQIVHDIIVEHLPKEGFALENFTPEEVIKGAVPQSFIWDFKKQSSTPSQDTTPPVEATTAQPETKDEAAESVQESGDNSTESIIEDTTSTGQGSGEATTVTNQAEVEDGKVTVLQGVTEAVREEERAKPFSLRNLIKAYFTQKKGDASNSPLVLVKDFMRNLNVLSDLSKYLSIDTKVNTKQKAQVEHFQKFAKNLAPVIARVFQGEFSKDPKNNLVRDLAVDGVLDENILTAIAVAAYGYLIRYSEPYNTDDSIRDIVRITKEDAIPPQVAELLRYAGQEAPYVEADLGKEIAKLLGLKALDDSSADLQSRLEKALGSLTTAALNDVGYVSVHTDVSHKAIGYLMRNAGYTGNEASGIDDGLEGTENLHALETLGKLTFIRVNYKVDDNAPVIAINKAENIDPVKVLRPARNKDGLIIIKPLVWGTDLSKTSPNDLNDILKNSEETKGILDKVFNNDVGYTKPLMVEPEALDAKTKQGTNNSISKTQKELVEEGQKTAFSIRANTVNVLRTLKGLTDDSKLLKQLLGIWVDDNITARTHITDRESLESKAKNEWRTLTNGLEWADITSVGNDEYADFYDAQYVTQNERMQYLANLFNMQGSQIHRAMASLSAFKLEIDLTDTSSANENLQRFYQAVGEGLEKLDKDLQDSIKKKAGLQQFFTVDKVSADNYVEALQEYLAGEISTNAIAAMIKVLAGKTPTDTEQDAIALFVEKGGMNIQSLQSLIALAEMQTAINTGQTSFITTVGLGSDGVNNGVATANILTGVITREMKQQVGMLPKIPTKYDPVPFTNMQEVYAKGKPDYYISFGAVMGRFLGLLRDSDTEKNKQWRDSVQALFPLYKAIQEASLEMRKIAKTWSIPFNYGAGKKSLQRALARGFMAGIYKDMNKIANTALDLEAALDKGDITQEVFNTDMAALRLKANTLQDNINNILKRGRPDGKGVDGKTKWKTTFKIKLPKDLTKLNDYNFDEAQVGQIYYGQLIFEGDVYTGTSNAIVDSLTEAVTSLHGKAAWQATEDYAFEYTRVRDLLNTVHTASYMLYENMRTDLIQAKLRAKREKAVGAIEKRNKEINASNDAILEEYKKQGKEAFAKAKADPRWEGPTIVKDLVKEFEYLGLTTEELREIDNILKPVAPVLHSALSRETNNLNAGITLATTEDKVAKASDNKQVATSYVDKHRGKPRYNTSGLSFKAEISSGIKSLAMAVQGVDAYVAAYLQAKFPTLNVHDAGIFGLKYFVEATKYQNEIYLQAMVNYHLNTESVEALMRSYLGLKDFIASLDSLGLDETAKAKFINQIKIVEDNILNRVAERNPDGTVKTKLYIEVDGGSYDVEIRKGVFKGLNKAFEAFGMLPKENLIEALQALVAQAIQQDMAKLKSLKDLKSVHQYSGEGGAFIIGGKGSDLSEAEHLRRIEAQEELLKLKERTLLQQLEREGVALDLVLGKKTRSSSLLNFLTTNKDKEVDVKDIVTILRGDSSLTRSTVEFDRQLAILDGLDGLLDGVKVIYKDVESTDGITDSVRGYYASDTNTITLRANAKYAANPVLVLHELLHSGLAARLETLRQVPKTNEKDYIAARKALARLEALRQEVLSKLVAGIDASKYFELKTAFEEAGGWDAYKAAQESLKNNKDYVGNLTQIDTLWGMLKEKYQKLNTLKGELNTENAKEFKKEIRATYEDIAAINNKIKGLNENVAAVEKEHKGITESAKAFLKLHRKLKSIMFTIEGGTEITALTMVERLESVDEFISYGLTEQTVQDILQSIDVVNTEERKQVSALRGMWGKFVKAVSALFVRPNAEVVPALSAFILDTADLLRSIRNEDVPRLPIESPTRLFSTSADGQVNQMSSIEVMQSLPHTGNADFGLHLNNLAETVISQVYNNDEVAKAEIDVIQAIRALPAIKAGFNLSQREAAIQHSLELVLQTYLETSKGGLNVGQLWKIYAEAQKNIKVSDFYDGDWSKATAQEVAATQQKYNYVINSSGKGVESLARFISMGLATEEVHNLLGFNTVTAKPSKQKSWFDTLNGWVRYIAAWLGNKLVKTSPLDPAYKQLQGLVNNLTALDIRNRQAVVSIFDKAWNLVGKATQPLDTAAQKLRQYATNRDFLRKSKYLPLRTLGSIASLDAKAMGETIPALIRETRDKARPNEKLGEAMTALMESTAMSAIRKSMEALIRQANLNAKDRQDRNDNVKKAIMAWFKDNGKHISKEMHKAITYTLLRTDAQSLLTTFDLDKTIGLLLDTNKLKNEIDLVTKNISQYKNGVDMIHAAEDLGYYMVSNKGGMGLSKNPAAIAAGIGTNYQIALEDVDQALVGQLDVLASLFAMKYTSAKDRKVLGEMYKENPEALHGLLNMHKGFMADAETEFKDNPLNYIKGWMPEIVNPYREVRAASGIDERDQMLKEGWKVIEEVKPHGKFLMVHADIGYQRLVSGAVDLQNSHRKGTEIVNRQSKQYLSTVKANLAYTAHRASIPLGQYDPTKKPTGLIPTYDTDGVPMAFNYEMASWVRDKEMERNNNFADLMGSYAGAMFYKPAKRNQSVVVANVLFEDFKQNYQKSPNSYIKLSGKSSDPRIVEMWRMLPKDFRQRATELYGKGEPIIINNEAFLLAFGFKKWTITNIWNKQPNERTHMETMFVHMAEGILGDTAKAKIAKAGHIWTEAVSKAKDFIVIRSISVLWHNVIANGLMLMAHNINPITIGKEWTFATTNVRAYQTLNSELIQLKANTLAGKGNSATEAQIKRIESQLEANPMSRYINAGLLSSIVEDVTIQQGDYSYDSELKKKIDNVTGWLPDSVKTLGAWAVFSPSTKAYQFLATTTQLSDFVAKVTLAKHLESKGMDFKAAISEASQTFINYDVPQGVGMQYMNDIGLFMFTKFFLRIQAILFKLLDKKAATVLAQHIAVESLTDMQGLLSPSVFGSIGNWPLEEGAASIVGAAMSIAPVNAGLGIAGF